MRHSIVVAKCQVEALQAGETTIVIAKTEGNIQKGDEVHLGDMADASLDLGFSGEFVVRRVHAGTKENGVLPGFAVLELRSGDLLIEDRRPPAKRSGRGRKP